MGKWKWRFLNESGALWRRVIVELHGVNGGFDQTTRQGRNSGTWANIVRSCFDLEQMGVDLDKLMERKVLEDGVWHAKWAWRRHPTGRASGEVDLLVSLINGLVLDSNIDDKWFWSLDDSGGFSVKSLSRVVQDLLFSNNDPDPSFTWNSWVPLDILKGKSGFIEKKSVEKLFHAVPRVLVTRRSQQLEVEGDGNENVPLYYYITDNIQIQFRREGFFLVTGLRFEVENLADYNDRELPIPFRRRVFPSCYDGEHITCYTILEIIEDEVFDRLHDEDDVSLCCLGILQLVLLGVEAKCRIPDWMLRLVNDRVGWDNYPWGSFVWPTLYSQLKNKNVKRWPKLYATRPTTEINKKAYSIFGYTWAFKTWILESFRVTTTKYYNRYNRYHRVAAWKKRKFVGSMGNLPAARLTPDETEARSNWWISSRAYFEGGISQAERVPRHLKLSKYV
ncbi:phospholipase-like protein [Tanacetum coccineum]